MEIIKDHEGQDQMAIKAKVSISHTAKFEDAIIYISVNEFTECLEAALSAKIADGKSNPFWKVIETKGTPR